MKAGRNLLFVAVFAVLVMCGAAWAVDSNGLVAHWKFDEGEGGIAYDSAGNNHGTLNGDPTWVAGQIGDYALDFDGDGDYVEVPDDDSLTPSSAITISFWLYNRGGQSAVICKYAACPDQPSSPGNSRSYHMKVENETDLVRFHVWSAVNTYDVIQSVGTVSKNAWHHIAGTFDNGDAVIYIDGQPDNSTTLSVSSMMNDAQPLIIGGSWEYCGNTFRSGLNGTADDVRIYDRALSAEEIPQLYEEAGPPPGDVFYVDGVNGSDDNDGLSLETAFATIQKGIDTAEDGDTVLVYPAVYLEEVNFRGKAITVQGVPTDAGGPVIEAPMDFAVSLYMDEGPDSVLSHFVIRGSEMGMFLADASPTINHLTVVDNEFGIGAYGDSEPNISNCIFWNNMYEDLFGCEAQYSWLQEDINEPNLPEEGLIAHWKLDEGDGTTAYDSASDNDGTIYGATWTTGILDGGLDFDGDDGVYVEGSAGEGSLLNIYNTDLTISSWVKIRGTTETTIVARSKEYHTAYRLGVTANKAFINTYRSGHWSLSTDEILTQDTWYYIVGVFDRAADTGRVYVNGAKEVEGSITTDPLSNDAMTKIGCRNDIGDRAFDGIIDEVAIWSRALSDEEVYEVYESGLAVESGPMFADANGGDYHLLSERGRYWPEHNVWVLDEVTSPCVDAGDPTVEPSNEPMPNGGRINMGGYGNTAYASMSEWPIRGDVNRDGVANMIDVAILAEDWLEKLAWFE